MPWDTVIRDGSAVTAMNSNAVGTMDDGFFSDLSFAFESLRENHPGKPVVLSSAGKMFSPGLDLGNCVSLFKRGDKEEIDRWFEGFLKAALTVFEHPAPVAAAIGGHAIAGGCILALCCDIRIAEKGKTLLGLNETSIGFPMPASLAALVEGVLGQEEGSEVIDGGKLHSVEQALENGIVSRIAEPGGAVDEAVRECAKIDLPDFIEVKKARNSKIAEEVRGCFENEDRKMLAAKLSNSETVGKLDALLETLKKGRK